MRRRMLLVGAIAFGLVAVFAPVPASAGLLDFLFGNDEPAKAPAPQPQSSSFADPSAPSAYPSVLPSTPVASGGGRFTAYCVRTCDGRYFPISARGGATPAQMCQSFCPASATKVFSGNSIDYAVGNMGERYVDSPNAFAYRKSLKADCTCNGRDSAGLAPVDLSLDTTLRPGDIVATSNGLVAYSGVKTATGQTAEFTPVASYPGLTADMRAKLGEMKVAPVTAEIADEAPYTSSIVQPVASQSQHDALRPLIDALPPLPTGEFRQITAPRSKRVEAN